MLPVLLAGLAAGCSPAALLDDVAPRRLVADGVPYGSGPRQVLDVYAPDPAILRARGPAPVLLFLQGGDWTFGSRATYRFLGGTFAERGFVTVVPDYRLYPQVRFPAFLQDCALALAWTLAHARRHGGEPGPLWLMGHSAGAYNAAMLALDPAWLAAVGTTPRAAVRGLLGLAGPYDFLPMPPSVLPIFASAAADLALTQPITFASAAAPPSLLLAGAADRTVDPANTRHLAARLRADGAFVEERIYPGIGHLELIGAIGRPLHFLAPTLRDCLAFMGAR